MKTIQSLWISGFRRYLFSMIGQWATMQMLMLVQSLLIYRITGSATLLGVLILATAIPQVVFSLFGGVLADRFPKKYIIQFGQAGAALLFLVIALCISSGYISSERPGSWWVLLVTAVLQGTINAVMMTTRRAIIPELVSKELVQNAMSLNNMGMQIFQFVGPVFGGFIIDIMNFQAAYFVMSGLCILSIILTIFVPLTRNVYAPSDRNILEDIKEGLKYSWNSKDISMVIVFTLLCIIITQPLAPLLSIFAEDIFKTSATGLGILQGVMAVGVFIGLIVFATIPPKKRGLIILSGGLCLGLAQAAFAFSSSWLLALTLMAFIGVGRVGHMLPANTMLQTYSDSRYLGRVLSILTLSQGLGSVMTFFNGVLAEVVGVQWSIGGSGLFLVFASIIFIVFVPRLRRLD